MPSTVPCLGCGFELDGDGYLVRVGEVDKVAFVSDFSMGFKYCDPVLQRAWDVPFHLPWGLYDEAVTLINFGVPAGPPAIGFWQMPNLGPFIAANALYAPFRRVRLEGWLEVACDVGVAVFVNVSANGVSPPNLSDQLADGTTFGSSMPISVGISGPSMGPWTGWWNVAQPSAGAYVQFRLGAYKTGGGVGIVTRFALSMIDDGPARGVFYDAQTRFWPSPLPYP